MTEEADTFDAETGQPSIEQAVGHAVRAFRQERGISITDLASASGVSVAMLSRVESGRVAPSLRTMQAIAAALQIPIASLLKDAEQKSDATFLPPGGGLEVTRQAIRGSYIYRLLGHTTSAEVVLEPYINIFPSSDVVFKRTQYEGVKFLYMLEGEMTYQHGDTTYNLTPGSSLFFVADAVHGPERIVSAPAKLLSVQAFLRSRNRNQNI